MSSSWLIAPLAVWNCVPRVSSTECRRPLGSVSVTRSPGRRGPVRTPDQASGTDPGSAIVQPEQPELPAGTEGSGSDAGPAANELLLVALADRQHGEVEGG